MVEQAIVPREDAIDRVLEILRGRLESAMRNGQRIRMDAREGTEAQRVPLKAIDRPLSEALKAFQPDGSYELHIYIEPKR